MKKLNMFAVASVVILTSVSALANYSAAGYLVDERANGGYIVLQSEDVGYIAFDETTMTPELLQKVAACVNKVAAATYVDHGMLSELKTLTCQE